jgi:16S rRNA (guanine527-N7)-methyltransferase
MDRAFHAKLAALAERFGIDPSPLGRALELQLLDPTASTTVRDPEEALDRHVADSLVAVELEPLQRARSIADIGSGAGWPGLALAVALPQAHVVLVESAIRHCRYLERVVDVAALANVEVVHARVEEWDCACDVVTARAVASLPVVLEYAAPLLVAGGHVVAWKAVIPQDESAAGAAAAAELGLAPVEVRRVHPYPGARGRTLHVFYKVAPTPARFPRRPGMAVKRPLG